MKKWIKMHSHPSSFNADPEELISATEMTLDNTDRHLLKMHLSSSMYSTHMSEQDNLTLSIKEADRMIKDYFEKDRRGRGLNLYNPRKGYFENSSIDYNSLHRKYHIRNEIPFKDTMFDLIKYKQNKSSYIKEMIYDPSTGKAEIEAETLNFSFREIGQRANPVDEHAYSGNTNENPSYRQERLRERFFLERDYWGNGPWKTDEKASKRFEIKRNLAIIVKSRAKPICDILQNEQNAIDTLREMITEAEFRKFIKYGFILVKGQSGCIYQLFRHNPHTKVWKDGKVIKEICVKINSDKIPLTDNLIAFKTIIEGSEDDFEKLGNVYKMEQVA